MDCNFSPANVVEYCDANNFPFLGSVFQNTEKETWAEIFPLAVSSWEETVTMEELYVVIRACPRFVLSFALSDMREGFKELLIEGYITPSKDGFNVTQKMIAFYARYITK